jgi:hypothetical protein
MTVKVGPVPVYRYKHSAVERWANGRFQSVEATTNGNGKITKAAGRAAAGAVQISGPYGNVRGPADAVPLSHWNQASFGKPMFNQQEGKLLKITTTRVKPGGDRRFLRCAGQLAGAARQARRRLAPGIQAHLRLTLSPVARELLQRGSRRGRFGLDIVLPNRGAVGECRLRGRFSTHVALPPPAWHILLMCTGRLRG